MKRFSLIGLVICIFMAVVPAQAARMHSSDSNTWNIYCDSGAYIGFLKLGSDGYYSSSLGFNVSRSMNEAISQLVRNYGGSCS